MSLNIFIDMDGTLLNSSEEVDPRAKETLRQIRRKMDAEYPDSGLYLWSKAGGNYARSKADEHGLAGFFSGFVGKSDVIIDDNPSSVFPRRIILWKDDAQWPSLTSSIFTEFSPSSELIALVSEIKAMVRDTDENFSDLYDNRFPDRNPILFFGDLENAEILTLAVNPSATEFHEDRCWEPEMDASKLSFRLVNYFRSWNPPPHGWFTPPETKLRLNGCSYLFNTAHVDLSPRATKGMADFKMSPTKYRKMVSQDANKWLPRILNLAKKAIEVRFCYTMIPSNQERWPLLGRYLRDELPESWSCLIGRFKCSQLI
jgi:hypothetical protein